MTGAAGRAGNDRRYGERVVLGRIGVWWSGSWRVPDDSSTDVARELEALGYGALWSSGRFDPGLSPHFERLLASTTHIPVASGIVSIWASTPADIGAAVADLEARFPGRFLLGLGASHAPVVEHYARPYSQHGRVPRRARRPRRAGAAGPSHARRPRPAHARARGRARTAGAHPYFVPVEHTDRARAILGPGPLLAPEVAVVLQADPAQARELARGYASTYLALPNYTNNLRTFGFGDDDIGGGGSDRLIDAVIPWGDAATVADARPRSTTRQAPTTSASRSWRAGRASRSTEYRQLAAALLLS